MSANSRFSEIIERLQRTRARLRSRKSRRKPYLRKSVLESLENRRLLATLEHSRDFEITGASQFGPGQAVFSGDTGNDLLVSFDTGRFDIDAFDEGLNAGAKADFRVLGRAGLQAGYYANAGSIDVLYDEVMLRTEYTDSEGALLPHVIEPEVDFTNSSNSFFTTQSPTIGAYADLILELETQGSLTGRLPWPFNEVGGTVSLDSTLLDVSQELLSFNRGGSNQLRLLGEDVLAGGVDIVIPVSAVPPTSIVVAASQLSDGPQLLPGLNAEAKLSVGTTVGQLLPKSVKKSIDDLDNTQLKARANSLANTDVSVSADLGSLKLNIPQVTVGDHSINGQGILAGQNEQGGLANLLAGLDLNLGLKDVEFKVGPAAITVTPFNFQLSPKLEVNQDVSIQPRSTITYQFSSPVEGVIKDVNNPGAPGESFRGRSTRPIDPNLEKLEIEPGQSDVQVTPYWSFQAMVDNVITIDSTIAGTLTAGDLKIDADVDQWVKDLVGLPIDPAPLYHDPNIDIASGELFRIVKSFLVINETNKLPSFTLTGLNLSLDVDTQDDELSDGSTNSLREAIIHANNQSTGAEQVIYLDEGTYSLNLREPGGDDENQGDLDIHKNIRIVGAGVGQTSIDADGLSDRVFEVHPGATLSLENLTVRNGEVENGYGGGIYHDGVMLNLNNVELSGNHATNGGGIYSRGRAEITTSSISDNDAPGGIGGGIFVDVDGKVSLTRSTIDSNEATAGAGFVNLGTLELFASTVALNDAFGIAGAGQTSGILLSVQSTIAENSAPSDGGIVVYPGGDFAPYGTIVAGNGRDLNSSGEVTDLGYNLIGATAETGFSTGTLHGTTANPIEAHLSEFGNHGGPTKSYLLQPGSPAIDSGLPSFWDGFAGAVDQRGETLDLLSPTELRDMGATQRLTEVVIPVDDHDALPFAVQLLNAQGGENTIRLPGGEFAPVLSGDGSELEVEGQSLRIVGVGMDESVIDGRNFRGRVFYVNSDATLRLEELTVTGGGTNSVVEDGGGIYNSGQLFLNSVSVSGNRALFGGGIWGSATINNSRIDNNLAGYGGGIAGRGDVRITTSQIVENRVIPGEIPKVRMRPYQGLGGGIYQSGGVLELYDSLVAENLAIGVSGIRSTSRCQVHPVDGSDAYGGGIYISNSNGTIARTTISNNVALGGVGGALVDEPVNGPGCGAGDGGDSRGGAIYSQRSNVDIDSSTIVANTVSGGAGGIAEFMAGTEYGPAGVRRGGGIYSTDESGPIVVRNSVIANNGTADASKSYDEFRSKDISGPIISGGHNLVGVVDIVEAFSAEGDQKGVVPNLDPTDGADLTGYSLDPRLGPLQDNGGTTFTHLPLSGSPLIDAGDTDDLFDQRGELRGVGTGNDIGAVEQQTLFVSTLQDDIQQRSLRRAILDAQKLRGNSDPIDIQLPAGTYTLTLTGSDDDSQVGDLDITSFMNVRIIGAGPEETIIDASSLAENPFSVHLGGTLGLEGVTVIGATSSNNASIIYNAGNATITNAHLTAGRGRAGIANSTTGTMELENVAVTDLDNSTGDGGAVHNEGMLTATNVTLANNSAINGAGLYNAGGLSVLTNLTVAENVASELAGGVGHFGGTLDLRNSIVANNTGRNDADVAGEFASGGNNIIGVVDNATGFLGSDRLNVDPQLQSLTTAPMPHFAVQLTSPALEGGSASDLSATDMLGQPRVLGQLPDIGAIEMAVLNVTSVADTMIPGTLRFAIETANQLHGTDRITFDSAIDSTPIQLTAGELLITDAVSIAGNGVRNTIIDGQEATRLFRITRTAGDVTFDRVTLQNGRTTETGSAGRGGAIMSSTEGALTITDTLLTNNQTFGVGAFGGAIYSNGFHLIVDGATLTGNRMNGGNAAGGAISSNQGTLEIRNSTLADNFSSLYGGGVHIRNSVATIENSTITGNSASSVGGGLRVVDGNVEVTNSIIAGNASEGTAPDVSILRSMGSFSFNLIGNNDGSGLTPNPNGGPDGSGNLIGTAAEPIDPLVEPLQDNGGPTPTIAISHNSPAVNAGTAMLPVGSESPMFIASDFDQRHFRRNQGRVDMGAFELQSVQNVNLPANSNVNVVPLGAGHQVISFSHNNVSRSMVVSNPVDRLNLAPYAVPIGQQFAIEDREPDPITISIGDFETASDDLLVTVTSGNQDIIADQSIEISATGSERTLSFTPSPDTTGLVVLTVQVDDGDATGEMRFPIKVGKAFSAIANANTTFDLLAFDSDSAGDPTQFTLQTVSISSTDGLAVSPDAAGSVAIVDNQLHFATGDDYDELQSGETATAIVSYTLVNTIGEQFNGRIAIDVLKDDGLPPTVGAIEINADLDNSADLLSGPAPTSWQQQRSSVRSLSVNFSEIVNVDYQDFTLTNLGINAPEDLSVEFPLQERHFFQEGNVVTLQFEASELTDGAYRLDISDHITDTLGNSLDGDRDAVPGGDFSYISNPANRFYVLTSEWNGDGGVSVFDFTTFSYWFGQAVPTAPGYVDLNGDDGVSVFDFTAFSRNFGAGITYPLSFQTGDTVGTGETPITSRRTAANHPRQDSQQIIDSSLDNPAHLDNPAQWRHDNRNTWANPSDTVTLEEAEVDELMANLAVGLFDALEN